MALSASPMAEGTLLAGKYRVVRSLGSGGMGGVYEVVHELTKHRRALKLLHRGVMLLHADAAPRFLREASAAGRIGNPHICESFDAGTLDDGIPYILMELLDGEALDLRLMREGTLSFDVARNILLQACDGLQAAHDAGIVHRDIKPANLFIVRGAPPSLKLIDFGVSRFDADRTGETGLTGHGAMLGTPHYMAPEQLRGEAEVDGRADVYSLGVVLYECLSGARPYGAESLPALILEILTHQYVPLEGSRALPRGVDAVLARAMAPSPGDRYPSASAFAEALLALDASGLELQQGSERRNASDAVVTSGSARRAAWLAGVATLLFGAFVWLQLSSRSAPHPAVLSRPDHPPALPPHAAVPSPEHESDTPQADDGTLREPPQPRPEALENRSPASKPPAAPTRAREHHLVEKNPF